MVYLLLILVKFTCSFTEPAVQAIHNVLESQTIERVQNLNLGYTTNIHTCARAFPINTEISSEAALVLYGKIDCHLVLWWYEVYQLVSGEIAYVRERKEQVHTHKHSCREDQNFTSIQGHIDSSGASCIRCNPKLQ